MLAVMSSKHDYALFFGQNSAVPDDRWELRHFAVVERTPTSPRHPYSSVLDFWDSENWDACMSIAFDRKGMLWKIFAFQKVWSEDIKDQDLARLNHGVRATNAQSVSVIDVQNRRKTVNPSYGFGFPSDISKLTSLYDINKLEKIHR